MDRRSLSLKCLKIGSLLLCALAMLPNALAQTVADYAHSPAHLYLGSATTSQGSASDQPEGVLPADYSAAAVAFVEDAAGNLYFSIGSEIDMYYTADINGQVPPLLAFAAQNAPTPYTLQKGRVYAIAGEPTFGCSGGAPGICGDGSFAVNAKFGYVSSMVFDAAGNLYLPDQLAFAVRKIDQSNGLISTVAGDPMHSISRPGGDGGLAADATFTGPSSIAIQEGNLYVADAGANQVRKIDSTNHISTIAGDVTQPGVTCTDSDCGEGQPALGTVLGGVYTMAVNAAGEIYLGELSDNVVRKIGTDGILHTVAGTRGSACGGSSCGDGGPATNALLNVPIYISLDPDENLIISDENDNAVRAVRKSDQKIFTIAGSVTASQNTTLADEAALDGQPASNLLLTNPPAAIIDASRHLIVQDNIFLLWRIDAPPPKLSQTIDFEAPATVTFGADPIPLTARSLDSSNNPTELPITYTATPTALATVNGSTLTILGAGEITITASQAGDTTYAPAAPVTQTLTVQKAQLTVKADDISVPFDNGPSLPALTYHLSGVVKHDSASTAVSGSPVLQTTALPTSPAGKYPITIGRGTLASVNYNLTFEDGVLTITGGIPQTITFNALADVIYGAPAITLTATATSALPVTYTVSGPASVLGSRLVVTGTGIVSVTATQGGDSTYGPATAVTRSFQVNPATLTITANDATRRYNQPDPAFSYSVSGLVNGDPATVLTGTPLYLPPAANSVPGQYVLGLDPSGGTLFAQNYKFRLVPGTLTITKGIQTIGFPQIPDVPYGTSGVAWNASSSAGLPVTLDVSGPIRYTSLAFDAIPADGVPRIGMVTVTATQAGNDLYTAAAPVTQSFQTVKAKLPVNAQSAMRAFGAANPVFTYFLGGSTTDVILGNTYSGNPLLTTTADTASPPGDYPILVSTGSLQSPVYFFTFVNSTLTILPRSSFTLTTSPSSVTVSRGHSASVKLTLTPINDFSGSVAIDCSNLPVGINCVLDPQALTPTTGGSVTGPASGVLTITATGASASLSTGGPGSATRANDLLVAGMPWLPGAIAGLLLIVGRKRMMRSLHAQRMLLIAGLLLGLSGVLACGGPSKSSGLAQPGSATIQIVGKGVAPDGSQVVNQLDLTITVE